MAGHANTRLYLSQLEGLCEANLLYLDVIGEETWLEINAGEWSVFM